MFDIEGFPDPTGLSPPALAARFQELERQRRLLDAALAAVVGEAARSRAFAADGHASVLAWCRALGRWSTAEARHAARCAALADAHDGFRERYTAGEVGVAQADLLGRVHSHPRCGDEFPADLDEFLDRVDQVSFGDLRDRLADWVTLHDQDGAFRDRDHTHAHRDASIDVWDGAVTGGFRGTAADGVRLVDVFDRYVDAEFTHDWETAVALHGEAACMSVLARTDAQRRFDALVAIFDRAASTPVDATNRRPSVTITVDVHTLDSLCNPTPTLPTSRDVWTSACATPDGTPVPAADVLSAIWWGRIRTAIVDDHRTVVALGNHRRLFSGKARDAVLLHATHCVWPGCELPSDRCQADHLTEHSRGGPTRPRNGAPLCGRHNRFKSDRAFSVWRDEGGGWHTARPDGTEVG